MICLKFELNIFSGFSCALAITLHFVAAFFYFSHLVSCMLLSCFTSTSGSGHFWRYPCSSCYTPSWSNLCWIGLLFYHRWHVFYYFKKKKTNALDTIISGHVGRWPYFRPFKTIGETKWKLLGTFIWNFDYYKVIPVLQAIDKGNTNWRLWDLMSLKPIVGVGVIVVIVFIFIVKMLKQILPSNA